MAKGGLPLAERTLADRLESASATQPVGRQMAPWARVGTLADAAGFDEYFGVTGNPG